jgi:hypothetical protein
MTIIILLLQLTLFPPRQFSYSLTSVLTGRYNFGLFLYSWNIHKSMQKTAAELNFYSYLSQNVWHILKLKLIYDRRPVCLGVRHPSGTHEQFFFPLEISFRQLRVCYFEVPSLTSGRVCNLLYNCFWTLPEQSLLSRSPAALTAIFYCLIWDSPNLEGQVPVFIFPRNRVVQLYPRALGSLFVAS